ncbi:MAG: aldehyde dehydrogenase (NADP(+)) [Ferruginibacter sp.]
MFEDISISAMEEMMIASQEAFLLYRKMSLHQRANFMRQIAIEIEALGDGLIKKAMEETNLPEARLRGERARTIFQLNSYAEACEKGDWLEASIDTADINKTPPKPDIRKMLVPLGPVLVFGASNFPFAYSTAGGDTACAFAAGCSVIVKAHPAHAATSEMVANAIQSAVKKTNMPAGLFAHVHGAAVLVGETLVKHPFIKAVGFTGSFVGGKQLFDWGNQRAIPIPVFAEMGSVNPVFILPEKMGKDAAVLGEQMAASITLGVGQFCTNPGIMVVIENEALMLFKEQLSAAIQKIIPAKMLHSGIAKNYHQKKEKVCSQKSISTLVEVANEEQNELGEAHIVTTDAQTFLKNPLLHEEVFGPYSILIICKNREEMMEVAACLEGQLTVTVMGTNDELADASLLLDGLKEKCGRFILNGVPTGVEVCASMQHGGPFPATTDSRFTSVGANGIKRFARPLAFQNWPNELLPDELKNENAFSIRRMVNNEWQGASLES